MSVSHEAAVADDVPKAVRSRDAAASKESLLQAAQELFGQKGFERTTTRDIGERAGVDAALIARYFGSKADLYFAAVAAEDAGEQQPREFSGLEQMADAVVSKADDHGPGPIMQALIRLDASDDIRGAALQRVRRRLVDPLVVDMADQRVDRPELRARRRRGGHAGHQPLPVTRVVRGGAGGTERRTGRPHCRGLAGSDRPGARFGTVTIGTFDPSAATTRAVRVLGTGAASEPPDASGNQGGQSSVWGVPPSTAVGSEMKTACVYSCRPARTDGRTLPVR